MSVISPRLLVTALAMFALAPTGCGKVKDAQDRVKLTNDMKQLGISYLNFQDAEGHPPKSFDELNKKEPLPTAIANATVIWGAGMAGMCKDGTASEVVIAHTNAPGGSILVLRADGAVQNISKQEFDSARIAKPLAR